MPRDRHRATLSSAASERPVSPIWGSLSARATSDLTLMVAAVTLNYTGPQASRSDSTNVQVIPASSSVSSTALEPRSFANPDR
jgi:hypothetical protein